MRPSQDADSLFDVRELALPGPLVLKARRRRDHRGWLMKLFQTDALAGIGFTGELRELFVTSSGPRVVRGMHFQAPPASQTKLVSCLTGSVLDVVMDLRSDSPAFGRHVTVSLDEDNGDVLYVPVGFAHGFAVLSAPAMMLYAVTHVWEASCDGGVRWDSAGIDWPFSDAIVSERDAGLPRLEHFVSPFPERETST